MALVCVVSGCPPLNTHICVTEWVSTWVPRFSTTSSTFVTLPPVCQKVAEVQGSIQVRDLNLLLLGRTNFTGSDVRVVSGDLVKPRAFPRQSNSASWWIWERCFRMKWPRPQHINQLELRSILMSVIRGIRSEQWVEKRVFHLSDSYVSISVASKGRSSSRMLNPSPQSVECTSPPLWSVPDPCPCRVHRRPYRCRESPLKYFRREPAENGRRLERA